MKITVIILLGIIVLLSPLLSCLAPTFDPVGKTEAIEIAYKEVAKLAKQETQRPFKPDALPKPRVRKDDEYHSYSVTFSDWHQEITIDVLVHANRCVDVSYANTPYLKHRQSH